MIVNNTQAMWISISVEPLGSTLLSQFEPQFPYLVNEKENIVSLIKLV